MQFTSLAVLVAAFVTVSAQDATLPDPPTATPHVHYAVPEGQTIIQFAGSMHVPDVAPAQQGYWYLWPGLFLPNFGGVLQPVLSSGAGHWTINNTWYYGTTQDPSGTQNVQNYAFDVDRGQDIRFNMQKNSTWTSTVSVPGTSKSATHSFPMIGAAKADRVPYATFEVELWNQAWSFGPLAFRDVSIVATGTDASWCNTSPFPDGARAVVTGVTPTVRNGRVTCSIKSLTLQK